MDLIMIKIAETATSTVSKLDHVVDGKQFFMGFVIEDGFKEVKVKGQTRIPAGYYEVVQRNFGGHFEKNKAKFGHKFVPELKNVPGFSNILIHIGNTIADTEGCLLLNYTVGLNKAKNVFEGQNSTECFKDFYNNLEEAYRNQEKVFIRIIR